MKKKLTCFVIALAMTVAIPTVASAATFGGGNSYSKSLSYTYASTTISLAGGYSGTAYISATGYFHKPGYPGDTKSFSFSSSNNASAGGVTASCSIINDGIHTVGYSAEAHHSGSATFAGGTPRYTFGDDSKIGL